MSTITAYQGVSNQLSDLGELHQPISNTYDKAVTKSRQALTKLSKQLAKLDPRPKVADMIWRLNPTKPTYTNDRTLAMITGMAMDHGVKADVLVRRPDGSLKVRTADHEILALTPIRDAYHGNKAMRFSVRGLKGAYEAYYSKMGQNSMRYFIEMDRAYGKADGLYEASSSHFYGEPIGTLIMTADGQYVGPLRMQGEMRHPAYAVLRPDALE